MEESEGKIIVRFCYSEKKIRSIHFWQRRNWEKQKILIWSLATFVLVLLFTI